MQSKKKTNVDLCFWYTSTQSLSCEIKKDYNSDKKAKSVVSSYKDTYTKSCYNYALRDTWDIEPCSHFFCKKKLHCWTMQNCKKQFTYNHTRQLGQTFLSTAQNNACKKVQKVLDISVV